MPRNPDLSIPLDRAWQDDRFSILYVKDEVEPRSLGPVKIGLGLVKSSSPRQPLEEAAKVSNRSEVSGFDSERLEGLGSSSKGHKGRHPSQKVHKGQIPCSKGSYRGFN